MLFETFIAWSLASLYAVHKNSSPAGGGYDPEPQYYDRQSQDYAQPQPQYQSYREQTSGQEAVIRKSGSHFKTPALINGRRLLMLIDTGASVLSLTKADARQVGIPVGRLAYTQPCRTANGMAYVAMINLRAVDIEGIELHNVVASVAATDHQKDESLLGMSFLGRLSSVNFTPNALILRS